MVCEYCGNAPVTKHHVIFRSQGGSLNSENEIYLCFDCHYSIHHGKDMDKKNTILKFCYDKIRNSIDKCWKGKIMPKIVRKIKNGYL